MRGDRPDFYGRKGIILAATPHARGSTFSQVDGIGLVYGYPACAGIDRSHSRCSTSLAGLPRMRGDRPPERYSAMLELTATPHARGSTRDAGTIEGYVKGYPACAGIDLRSQAQRAGVSRLPRMRGDRPCNCGGPTLPSAGYPACAGIDPATVVGRRYRARATPHARGSTLLEIGERHLPGGYPACAGIDPMTGRLSKRLARLPRMRGDRPVHHVLPACSPSATPHARGSTPRGRVEVSIRAATPHARGSTPVHLIHRHAHDGYPACAGIDPRP